MYKLNKPDTLCYLFSIFSFNKILLLSFFLTFDDLSSNLYLVAILYLYEDDFLVQYKLY